MKKEDVVQRVRDAISQRIIAGCSLCFLENAKATMYYEGAQGFIAPFDSQAIEAGMLYDLASLTKVIATTTRILQLIDEQKITLKQSLKGILPSYRYPQTTIEDLLLHRSGLGADIDGKYHMDASQLMQAVYTAPFCDEPRRRVIYSDIGFILLGEVIQTIDQCTLEESFQAHIFQPLGMKHTSYMKKEATERYVPTLIDPNRGLLQGQVHDHKAYILKQSGSAGLFSTLDDLSGFVQAYLKQDERLFSKRIFSLCTKEYQKRTYGWDKRYGSDVYYHTGFTGTSILFSIKKQCGMILLTNRIHLDRNEQAYLQVREELHQGYMEEWK